MHTKRDNRPKNVTVSIIVPVYNTKKKHLRECFESISNQSYRNIEIIIVDDGSDGTTARYLDENKHNSNWKIIHQEKSGGNAARNRGYRESSGDYVIWLDADDIFDSKLVEKAVSLISTKKADISMWRFEVFDSDSGTVSPSWLGLYSDVLHKKVFSWTDVRGDFYQLFSWNAWTKMFSREFIENNNLTWNESLKASQDMDFCGRAMVLADKITWTDDILVKYRMNTGTQISETKKDPLSSYRVAKLLKKFLDDTGIYEELKDTFAKRIPDDIFYYLKDTDAEFKSEYGNIRKFLESIDAKGVKGKAICDKVLKHPTVKEYFGSDYLVSVVVPVYGVEKYLAECLDSILSQSYRQLEIILVDDKTPDKSGKIADSYAKRDERVKVIHKPKNEGLNMARATGFKASTGDFITFIDSDDKVLPDYVEKLVRAQVETNADITMCGYVFYDENLSTPLSPQPIRQHPIKDKPTIYSKDEMIHYYLTQWAFWEHNNNTTTTCCKLFKREVIEGLDWHEANYSIGEDDFETLYTFAVADKYAVVNDQMFHYRANPNSISNSKKFTPKYKGEPISVFNICHDFEIKAFKVLGKKHENEIYYRIYNLYLYYITLLINKGSLSSTDVVIFDRYFPINKLRGIKNHSIDDTILDLIEGGGLAGYVVSKLTSDIEDKQRHIRDVTSSLDRKSTELKLLHDELAGYLGIKRSVRLLAGNIKRRMQKTLRS